MADIRAMLQAAAGAVGGGGASTPWELTNATYNGTPFSKFGVVINASNPQDMAFSADGTKMYLVDNTTDTVVQYDLSIAWSVTSAKYVQNFSIAAQETTPVGLFFSPDGTNMYVSGNGGDDVNQYSLSTAWDVSTASYVRVFSVAAQDTTPVGLFFKDDGTKMYVLGSDGDDVNEYSLSTAWNIGTASYVQNFSLSAQDSGPTALFFKPDGTKMYFSGQTNDNVYEYSLSTAWDISSASYVQSFSIASESNTSTGLFFKDDGTKMYMLDSGVDIVFEYSLSSAWDISTASYSFPPTTEYLSVVTRDTFPSKIFFKPDGTIMYVLGRFDDDVNEYSLSTAWDITSASYVRVFSVAAQEGQPAGLFFKSDGTKMYIVGDLDDEVNEYTLSTAWNISTASHVQNFSVATQETAPQGIFFKPDGIKMYIVGTANDNVYEYSLSTGWDISTASYVQAFSVASQDTAPNDIFFKDDGTKMYVIGGNKDSIYEYNLSSAWDISTSSYVQSFPVGSQETNPMGIFFKPDGTKIYMTGSISDAVWSFDL